MIRALSGLLKGALIGTAVAAGLLYLGNLTEIQSGFLPYVACGLSGLLVGLVCGRAPWKVETIWVPILRSTFGLVLSLIVYALGHRFLPSLALFSVPQLSAQSIFLNSGMFLAPVAGALYGLFVEIDDGAVSPAR